MRIPPERYQTLRQALLACRPFDSDRALRALFIVETLRPWRKRLPAAESPQERVEQTIAFLADRYNTQGKNALILLLLALRDRLDPGDVDYVTLDQLATNLARANAQPATRPEVQAVSDVARRRGLIVAVSGGPSPTPADSAVAYHVGENGLTHCWLIVGPGEGDMSSPANAARIRDGLRARGVVVNDDWRLDDVDDVERIFAIVDAIVEEARLKYKLVSENIIADYTGGTKSLTAGMVLGAMATGIDLQYMKPNAYLADGRMDKEAGSSPRQVDITFATIDKAA